jgi:hypothetical protein
MTQATCPGRPSPPTSTAICPRTSRAGPDLAADLAEDLPEALPAVAETQDSTADMPDLVAEEPAPEITAEDAALLARFADDAGDLPEAPVAADIDGDLPEDSPAPVAADLAADLAEDLPKALPAVAETQDSTADMPDLVAEEPAPEITAEDAALLARFAEDAGDLPDLELQAEAKAADDVMADESALNTPVVETQADIRDDLATEAPAPIPAADLVADALPETLPETMAETMAAGQSAEAADLLPEDIAATTQDEALQDDATAPESLPAVIDKIQRARARVIKIRRADLDAMAPGADAPEAAETPVAAATPTLSPEAEADLARELAQLEAEKTSAAPRPDPRSNLGEAASDAALNRLLDQTNQQLQGPESRRRLSAISHLKAAVAATVADRRARGVTDTPSEKTRLDPYRTDLDRVVRPSRPDLAPSAAPRPAPLVLVSEQRIDRPRPAAPAANGNPVAPVAPVRPRRVSAMNLALTPAADTEDDDLAEDEDNLFVPARGFAEFAERLGATTLPEMLEAAVAYAACVEGRPHVSRPQMMRQVTAARPEYDGDRETMLRSFGTLLRDGRIEKVRRGQFALSDGARYLTEGKRIAG